MRSRFWVSAFGWLNEQQSFVAANAKQNLKIAPPTRQR